MTNPAEILLIALFCGGVLFFFMGVGAFFSTRSGYMRFKKGYENGDYFERQSKLTQDLNIYTGTLCIVGCMCFFAFIACVAAIILFPPLFYVGGFFWTCVLYFGLLLTTSS